MKLNLGSGQRPFSAKHGWVNVDSQQRWNPDVLCDISSLPEEWAGQAEVVVLHHTLEHFGLTEGQQVLKECYRVLAPAGHLLVFVPDLFRLAQRWMEGRIDDYTYLVNLYGAFMGDEADRHKWNYCYRNLHEAIRSAGDWSSIELFEYERDVPGADLARDWWILGVQAVKK